MRHWDCLRRQIVLVKSLETTLADFLVSQDLVLLLSCLIVVSVQYRDLDFAFFGVMNHNAASNDRILHFLMTK